MEKPSINKKIPYKPQYMEREKDIILYAYTEHTLEDQDICPNCETLEESSEADLKCTGQCLQENYEYDRDQPPIPKIKINRMNLQTLLDMLPEEVTPSDVTMSMYSHDWAGIPYTTFSFSYKKKFFSELDKYEIDKAEYDKEYAEWEEKQQAFNKFLRDKEIRELEDKIKLLKNK